MNWRLTTADKTVRFEEGEPIARIFPFPLALLDEMELELHDLSEDPEFQRQFEQWSQMRQQNYQERQRMWDKVAPGEEPDRNPVWHSSYAQGSGSEGAEQKHQTIFRCRPVKDARKKD